MLVDLVRDAPFGQLVRLLTGDRFFKYPEEKPDFKCPHSYSDPQSLEKHGSHMQSHPGGRSVSTALAPLVSPENERSDIEQEEAIEAVAIDGEKADPEKAGSNSDTSSIDLAKIRTMSSNLERTKSRPYTEERLATDMAHELEKVQSRPIRPTITHDGLILVDWYSTDDPANPQNWSQGKKFWTAFLIDIYSFVVYASSSIYISSQLLIMDRFGVQEFKASLGLALYVLGYGLGPLLFSPLSEVPAFGRNVPYITTFAMFTILALPTALVDNLGGLLVLRFLLGFFGSPCLASGGASMGDMYSLLYLPYSVAMWVSATFAAPALGPLLSGFAVYAENWRWSQWEILWMAGPVFLLFFFFLPETQPTTVLHWRAARLRKITGNEKIRTQIEQDKKGVTLTATILDAIIKPIEISLKDPAIMFVNLYTALTYGIYYSFFEVFPLVYPVMYGFNVGVTAVVFTCIIVGCIIAMAIYFSYLHFYLIPDIMKNGLRAQEHRLVPALFACFFPTVGLFIFGWTANADIHWIVSVIGITIYATSVYIILQCIFTYVPMSYPEYAASLFAGNDFCRSLFAFGAVLFGRPMYVVLGVGKGISVLGGLSVMGIIGMWLLYYYGARLRAKSKFAI